MGVLAGPEGGEYVGLELGKHHFIVRDQCKYGSSPRVKNTQPMPVKTVKVCLEVPLHWRYWNVAQHRRVNQTGA